MHRFPIRVCLALLLSAVLQVAIFPVAGPLPTWRAGLSWFALVPLLWALLGLMRDASAWQVVAAGYATGVLWYLGTCYWVYSTMHVYGGLAAPVAVLVMILFCLYLGLYHALFAGLLALVRRRGVAWALVASPFLWVAVELARARVTSFPWNLLGYAQVDSYMLTKLAPFTGVYGLSFVLAAGNAALAAALLWPRRRVTTVMAMCGAVLAAGIQNVGSWMAPARTAGSEKAVLLQPNLEVGQGEAGDAGTLARSLAGLSVQASALDTAPTRVVLWPESPSPFQTDRQEFTLTASGLSKALASPVIAGGVGIDPATSEKRGYRIYNSAVLFTPEQGAAGRYDKIHLVPFGEFTPYADLFSFASGLTQAVGTFDRGRSRAPLLADGHRYGVFLCYESIFGDEVRQFVAQGAEVLTNLSDDGWYGDTSAPFQHLNMARMRAIETHRWLLRDTNNGITGSVDPDGRVVERMERHQRGAVAVHFHYLHDLTFYTRNGDVFGFACAGISLALLLFPGLRPRAAID